MGTSLFDLGFNGPGRKQPVQLPDLVATSDIPQDDVGLSLYFAQHPNLDPHFKASILAQRARRMATNAHDIPASLPGAASRQAGGLLSFLIGGPVGLANAAGKGLAGAPEDLTLSGLWQNVKEPMQAAGLPFEQMAQIEDQNMGVTPGSAGTGLVNDAATAALLAGAPAAEAGVALGSGENGLGKLLSGLERPSAQPIDPRNPAGYPPEFTTVPDPNAPGGVRQVAKAPEGYMRPTLATPEAAADVANPQAIRPPMTELERAQQAVARIPEPGSPLRRLQDYGPEEVVARQRLADAQAGGRVQTPVELPPPPPEPVNTGTIPPIQPLGPLDRLRLEGRRFTSDIGALLKQSLGNLGERGSIPLQPEGRGLFRPAEESPLDASVRETETPLLDKTADATSQDQVQRITERQDKERELVTGTGGKPGNSKFWGTDFVSGKDAGAAAQALKAHFPDYNGTVQRQPDGTFALLRKNPVAYVEPGTAVAVRPKNAPVSPRFGESESAVPTEGTGGALHSRLGTVLGKEFAGEARTLDDWEGHLLKNPRVPKLELNDLMKTLEEKGIGTSGEKYDAPALKNLLDEHGIVNQLAINKRGNVFTPGGLERKEYEGGGSEPNFDEEAANEELAARTQAPRPEIDPMGVFPTIQEWAQPEHVRADHPGAALITGRAEQEYEHEANRHYDNQAHVLKQAGEFPSYELWRETTQGQGEGGYDGRQKYLTERDRFNLTQPFPDEETWVDEHGMGNESNAHQSQEYEAAKAAHAEGDVYTPERTQVAADDDDSWLGDMPDFEDEYLNQDIPDDVREQEAEYQAEQEQDYNQNERAPNELSNAETELDDLKRALTEVYGEQRADALMARLHDPEENPHTEDTVARFPEPHHDLLNENDTDVRNYMADQHFGDDFIDEWLGIGGHTPDANQLGFGFGEDQPVLSDVNRSFIRNKLQNADEHLRQAMDFSHDDVDIEQRHYEQADESLSDYWQNQMDNDIRGYHRWLDAKQEEWMDENRPDAPTEDDLREQRFDRIRVAQNSAEGSHQSRRLAAVTQYDQAVDARARRMLAEYHAQQEAEGYAKRKDYAYQPAYRGTQRPQSFGGASTGGYNEMLLQRPNWELDPAKGHWANKAGGEKTIGHTRNMEFGRMGHLQESQSDMGQLARGYNLPPEVWRAQLDRTAAANGLPPLSDKQFETYRKNASLAGPMAGPFTDTEAWTQANVSMTMHEMAKARKDYFSWPNSADRLESASLSSEGRTKLDAEGKPVEGEHEEMGAGKITYDKYTTQAVKRAVESLGFKYEPEFYDPQTKKVVDTNKHKVEVYDVATGNNIEEEQLDPKIVTRVKLTPEIRAAIAQHGLPALSVAALAAGTASSAGSPGRSAPARPARVAGKKSLMD